MKNLALIGSASFETTLRYVRTINRECEKKSGLGHTAELLILTGDSARFQQHLEHDEWAALRDNLARAARTASAAGADALVVCGSCLNPLAKEIGQDLNYPVVSLGQAVAATLARFRFKRAGFLGLHTEREAEMWGDFLSPSAVMRPEPADERLLREIARFAADADVVPDDWQVATTRIISRLRRQGANAIVLCAPELSRWVHTGESLLPVIEAGEAHAWAAALWALGEEQINLVSN